MRDKLPENKATYQAQRRRILLRIIVHWIGIPTRQDCYSAYQAEIGRAGLRRPSTRTYRNDWTWCERQVNMGRGRSILEKRESAIERARLIASDAALDGEYSDALRGVQLESDLAGYAGAAEDESVSAPRRAAEFDQQRRESEHVSTDPESDADGEPDERRLL